MSEKQHHSAEVLEDHEANIFKPENQPDTHELASAEKGHAELLDSARHEVAKHSSEDSKERLLSELSPEQAQTAEEEEMAKRPINSDLKHLTFQREIRNIRRRLGKADRVGSKIIHQPAIRSISDISARTITRPSGLLGGGIVAFLGTGTYLYLTKHIGIKYNYSMFFFLLIAGFVLGLIIESLIRLSRGRKAL